MKMGALKLAALISSANSIVLVEGKSAAPDLCFHGVGGMSEWRKPTKRQDNNETNDNDP